jgi:hypothetical protein
MRIMPPVFEDAFLSTTMRPILSVVTLQTSLDEVQGMRANRLHDPRGNPREQLLVGSPFIVVSDAHRYSLLSRRH